MYKNHNDKFSVLTNLYRYARDKHAPLKSKTIRSKHHSWLKTTAKR